MSDDFGFSLVSEDELRAHENELKNKLSQQTTIVQSSVDKLHGLRDMLMPLLQNLARDPQKEYILWPDRAAKIQAFIDKVNAYVGE